MSLTRKIEEVKIRLEQAEQALARAEMFDTGDVKVLNNVVSKLERKLESLEQHLDQVRELNNK